jgi:hypothetical protein
VVGRPTWSVSCWFDAPSGAARRVVRTSRRRDRPAAAAAAAVVVGRRSASAMRSVWRPQMCSLSCCRVPGPVQDGERQRGQHLAPASGRDIARCGRHSARSRRGPSSSPTAAVSGGLRTAPKFEPVVVSVDSAVVLVRQKGREVAVGPT